MVADFVVLFSTPQGRIADVNVAACHHLGFNRRTLRRMSLVEIAPHAATGEFARNIARAARGHLCDAHLETVYRHQDTRLLPVQCLINPVNSSPNNLILAVARPIHAENRVSSKAFDVAVRDPLTGLLNRDWLMQQLELAAGQPPPSNARYAILFIDVDRFKNVNDSFGHLVGDAVLQAVARRLVASVRPGDTVVRYGGDEFVVLMKGLRSAKSIASVAARIGRRVNAAGMLPGGKSWRVRVTMSIGAAECEGGHYAPLAAIDCADRAMYRAKSLGRNGRFVIDRLLE
jgi:diguanylate cyclase (GGDEF)-like protein